MMIMMMIYIKTNKKITITNYFILDVPGNNCFLPTDS